MAARRAPSAKPGSPFARLGPGQHALNRDFPGLITQNCPEVGNCRGRVIVLERNLAPQPERPPCHADSCPTPGPISLPASSIAPVAPNVKWPQSCSRAMRPLGSIPARRATSS